MAKQRIREENRLLEELALEMPEKLYFSEAGTIMQDYIKAYIKQFSPLENDLGLGNSYVSHLLYAVVERINKNSRTIN
jgi:hypothetical protein